MSGLFEQAEGYYLVPVADDVDGEEECFGVDVVNVSVDQEDVMKVEVDISTTGAFEFALEELMANVGALDSVVEDTAEAQIAVLLSELVHSLAPAVNAAVLAAVRTRLSI